MSQLSQNGNTRSQNTPARRRRKPATTQPATVQPSSVDAAMSAAVAVVDGNSVVSQPDIDRVPETRAAWEGALLARWGRLHLLLTVVAPLLPEDHPRLRMVRQALFSTYQELRALGVEARPLPQD